MKTSIKLITLIFSLLTIASLNLKAQDINTPVTPKTTTLGSGIRLSAGIESGLPIGKPDSIPALNLIPDPKLVVFGVTGVLISCALRFREMIDNNENNKTLSLIEVFMIVVV